MKTLALLLLTGLVSCGSVTDSLSRPIDDAPGKTAWADVSVGEYSACGLTTGGVTYCWGWDQVLECVNSACPHAAAPHAITGAPLFSSISVGGFEACGITSDASLYCWGNTPGNTLGDGVTVKSQVPIRIPIPGAVTQFSAGYYPNCAVSNGSGFCWGMVGSPLGAGAGIRASKVPLPVISTVAFRQISAGNTQACGIATDGDAYCWGSGYGSLGLGARDTSCALAPSCTEVFGAARVDGALKWVDISAANTFTCGVTTSGDGYCWGDVPMTGSPYGPIGVLGSGKLEGSKSPTQVAGGIKWRMIRGGTRQACGVSTSNVAYCWGYDVSGQVGIGSAGQNTHYTTPQEVAGKLAFTRVAAGQVSCGVTVSRNLYCWGANLGGILGSGNENLSYASGLPVRVADP